MAHIFDDQKWTAKQAGIALSLTDTDHQKENGYTPISTFKYGGRWFIGDYTTMVVLFVNNNPTGGDFFVWLQDHAPEVKRKNDNI